MGSWKRLLISGSIAKVTSLFVTSGATKVANSGSLFVFANDSDKQVGYMSSSDSQSETVGLPGYDTDGNLTVSSLIDGGTY